jgi:hypothetical protein
MVVYDFNVYGIAIDPNEAYSPLIVDPDAVLSFPVSTQRFQPVRRWNTQVVYRSSIVQHPELAPGDLLNALGQALRTNPVPDCLRFPGAKALDRDDNITLRVI